MKSLYVRFGRQFRLPQATVPLLVGLLLTSFGLRVYRLGDKSVWWDEGYSVWMARHPFIEIIQQTAPDVHPPLYYWVLRFWQWGSGEGEFGLRFLSVLLGALRVAATYRLGRAIGGLKVGLLAALLMNISRFDIWWSQEIRMYSLTTLFSVFSLWATIRFWDTGQAVDGAFYVLSTTAGLYTLYLYAPMLLVVNVAWLWGLWRVEHRRQAFVRWGIVQAITLALFVPWLVYALARMPTRSSASPVALDAFLRIYWTMLTTGISVGVESYYWLTLPVLAIFLTGLASLLWSTRRDWRARRRVVLLLLGLMLPAVVVYIVSLPREILYHSPQLAPRYLLVFAPAFYVLLAWGLSLLGKGRLWPVGTALAVIVVGAAIYGLWGYYPGRIIRDDYKSLAATLRAYRRPEDAIVLYTDKDWPVFAYHHPGEWLGVPYAQPVTSAFAVAYLSPIWRDHQGVWLVVTPYAGVNDPQGEIPAWLSTQASHTVEYRFADKVLRLYARTEKRAANAYALSSEARPSRPLEVELKPGLWVTGYERPVREYQSGDTIHLFLHWQRKGDGRDQVADFGLNLVDKHGQAWKHVSATAPAAPQNGNTARQQIDLVVPPNAPRGDYAFTLQPLPGGETVRFGRVSIRQQGPALLSVVDVDIAHPLETDFDDGIRLLGYEVGTAELRPGDIFPLTLYWQALQPVERRYKVFTHVLGQVYNADRGNFLWGQQDNEPVNATRPTSTWRTDEIIVDSFAIPLDPRAPGGDYAVEIGLYDPATGERLAVLGDRGQTVADHVVLTQVSVESE